MRGFDDAVARIIAPRLAAIGFARRRLLWNRRHSGRVEAIELQQSRNNTSFGARFTANLGVGRAAEEAWLRPVECRDGGARLGQLRPERQDYWWCHDPTEAEETDAALRSALADFEAYGLPYLARNGRLLEPRLPDTPSTDTLLGRLWARLRGGTAPRGAANPPAPTRTPKPWNGWDGVARGAIDRVKREVATARPALIWAISFGAVDIDPRHLAIHYGFATDADLEEAERNGLQARLRALTLAQLGVRGYPAAALEHVGIGFASQEDIDRTAGGNGHHYFK